MHKKTYVLDTNVLLSDVDAINSFDEHDVIIPLAVIEELDKQKSRPDEVGAAARIVSRKLDELRLTGSLLSGVTLPAGGQLYVRSIAAAMIDALPLDLHKEKIDNHLIAFMHSYLKQASADSSEMILVSRDINVRIKCDALGIPCQDYLKMHVTDEKNLYTGVQTIETDASVIGTFYNEDVIETPKEIFPNTEFFPNQIVILKNTVNGKTSKSALTRYSHDKLIPLKIIKDAAGFKPRNKEQEFALDLLFDDSIKLVTLVSRAGTGKTSLALAAGLAQLEGFGDKSQAKFQKLIVSRPVMPLGKDIGFLPGTIEEKMAPWIAPVKDALNFLMGDKKPKSTKKTSEVSNNVYLQMMQENGLIEVEAITYIRGRSIPNAFVIIDEAQNLSQLELKTIITRVGEGTKIVLTGDIQQIDNTHVDVYTNGLTYCVEKFKTHDIAAHVTLRKGERSELATIGSNIL